ncbi:MAG: DNA repair protein [Sphaerochaeta sp.]|jgi:A/G-specific adenine glycosylase|uniref:DNA repair protein n=1 Tax=Sphaerochaeta sp. TaxID=1972642 RepID=UPI002FCA0F59
MTSFPQLSAEEASSYLWPPFTVDPASLQDFRTRILNFYARYGRKFAWRETNDPYHILLSEVMLQQTQTNRVAPKYALFLSLWPTFRDLAGAPLDELLFHWKGLGYNRRALNLRKSAKMTEAWGWTIPSDPELIASLPGVGKSTSAAILAFSYQKQAIYLETNIRRVLLTCFFSDREQVKDKELESLLALLLEGVDDYRQWYYALMDYGVLLKQLLPNANVRSAHYAKQGRFEQSNRQLRGQIIHLLSDTGAKSSDELMRILAHFTGERIEYCLSQLCTEGFVQETDGVYRIPRE